MTNNFKVTDKMCHNRSDDQIFELDDNISIDTNTTIKISELATKRPTLTPDLPGELHAIISATGDVKDVLTADGSGKAATSSLEIIFEKAGIGNNRRLGYQITTSASIATVDDTVKTNYGSSLLVPKAGKYSGLIDFVGYYMSGKNSSLFFRKYLYLSTTTWLVSTTNAEGASMDVSENGSIAGCGLLLGGQLFKRQDKNRKNFAAVILQAGLAYRMILGNLKQEKDLRKEALGPDNTCFMGFEMAFATFYRGLTVGLNYFYFGKDIPGFSAGQATGGISVSVELVEF